MKDLANDEDDHNLANALSEAVIHIQNIDDLVEKEHHEPSKTDQASTQQSPAIINHVLNSATAHAITERLPRALQPLTFKGIMIYTGAARASSGKLIGILRTPDLRAHPSCGPVAKLISPLCHRHKGRGVSWRGNHLLPNHRYVFQLQYARGRRKSANSCVPCRCRPDRLVL